MGSELMCSYRATRELAIALAGAGLGVVRVDYHGTGDSAGHDTDPGRVAAWLASVDAAIDEVRRRTGASRIAMVGIRIGGTLAAACAARRGDVDRLVLWGACRSGKTYVREMRMLRLSEATSAGSDAAVSDLAAGEGELEEAGGFALTAETIAELGGLDLASLGAKPAPRVLVVARDDLPADKRLVKGLVKTGAEVVEEAWPGFAKMMLAPHYSVAPVETYAKMAAWLREGAADGEHEHGHDDGRASTADFVEDGGIVHEHAYHFGALGYFGVLSEPGPGIRRRPTAVLLANTGANYHVGPNRMYVKMARLWAARGFPVLRMDLSGIGDSPVRPGGAVNKPYTDDGIRDLDVGLAELRARTGAERLVVLGLCSGAYVAFHASLGGSPLTNQILVNPQTFYWKEGMSLDVAPGVTYDKVNYYKQSARSWASWKKALTGKIQYRAVAKLLARRARDLAETRLRRLGRETGLWPQAEDVGRDLRAIAERGVDTLIVFSTGDPGIDYLRQRAQRDIDRLQRRDNFRIEYIEGADHTFTAQWAQARLGEVLSAHLERVAR